MYMIYVYHIKTCGELNPEPTCEDPVAIAHINVNAIHVYMGWLRLVGSIKLLVSFAKEPYKRDDILQQRPII